MAVYCGDIDSSYLIENAGDFKDACFIQGQSLFTDHKLWTLSACQELIQYFVENLEEGEGDFLAKLETQLADASSKAKALAAEMLWLMFLCPSSTGPASKRATVERVFSWSGFEVKKDAREKYLSDEALTGIGKTGAAYQTGRWRELVYFIRLSERFLKLHIDERERLLSSRTEFSKWLNDIPENDKRQFRHMILYLLYPEEQERIFGGGHRKSLLETFLGITPSQFKKMSALDIDNRLLEIRTNFEKEFGTKELDYYVEPLLSKWKQPKTTPMNEIKDPGQEYKVKTDEKKQTLNTILYGPPGTGKTYNTINKALEIVDPDFYYANKDNRISLKTRFDELLNSNCIGFVTFHQSFSYEDFVEGLKATTENNQVKYEVEDGIFKRLCESDRAKLTIKSTQDKVDTSDRKIWEMSLGDSVVPGNTVGKYQIKSISDELTTLRKPNGSELPMPKVIVDELCRLVRVGDVTVEDIKQKKVFDKVDSLMEKYLINGYPNVLGPLVEGIVNNGISLSNQASSDKRVLIIDEINRGNISNIFGELITLIEPSKRAGGEEALSVKLPYSKEVFSVPQNLHIIGTMNTADKSLAQLDVALRRRFQFEEMMTNYELLSEIPPIEGIDVERMVRTINNRIELLFDREHTLGHSFFLPLVDTPSIELLAEVFELQILPLLEEYFFEDWERVAMVLGDHLKTEDNLRFVVERFNASQVAQLMGNDWDLAGVQPYVRNKHALKQPNAYIGIYS